MINKKAIENFLVTMDIGLPLGYNLTNAIYDARNYKWDVATLNALTLKIYEAYGILAIELVRT
jgi:hypothetical protein